LQHGKEEPQNRTLWQVRGYSITYPQRGEGEVGLAVPHTILIHFPSRCPGLDSPNSFRCT